MPASRNAFSDIMMNVKGNLGWSEDGKLVPIARILLGEDTRTGDGWDLNWVFEPDFLSSTAIRRTNLMGPVEPENPNRCLALAAKGTRVITNLQEVP